MVALQILALSVRVRVLLSQLKENPFQSVLEGIFGFVAENQVIVKIRLFCYSRVKCYIKC